MREAHHILERWRLVAKDDAGRSFITNLTVKDVQECYSMRIQIEPMVAARAYEHVTPDQLEQLTGLYERMRDAVEKRDFVQLSKADIAFHEFIWKMPGSKWFENTLREICLPLMAFQSIRLWSLPRYDFTAFLEGGHLPLLNALKNGPSAKVVKEIFADILNGYCTDETRILVTMEERGQTQAPRPANEQGRQTADVVPAHLAFR
jgi:DNA-binding GntR family transcriptional regulator